MALGEQQHTDGQGFAPLRGAGQVCTEQGCTEQGGAEQGGLADPRAEIAREAALASTGARREAPRYMGFRPQPDGRGDETRGARGCRNPSHDGQNQQKGGWGREGVRAACAAARTTAEGGAEGDAPRASLYDDVTNRIIAELESGRVPWVQPWGNAACGPALPRNALTGRAYSGVNVLILWGALIERDYPTQSWVTFKQARNAGGSVIANERGTTVVYADRFTPEAEKARALETGDAARAIPFLKRFTVFNVAQCEGLRDNLASDPAPLPDREIVPVAEQVIAASGVRFRIGGPRAFYVPALDVVHVPPQPAFFDQINYYRTALHELTHATGHHSRLNRDQTGSFGSKDYAREELIAEMGSAFLCASLGIVPTVRHADYLASWLDVLRADNRAIFRAASAASKAADWLLSRYGDNAVAADAEAAPPARRAA